MNVIRSRVATGGLLSAILIAQVALMWDAIDQASPTPDEFGLLVGGLDSIVNGRHDILAFGGPSQCHRWLAHSNVDWDHG
ncbi:hypothetical protein [Crateriforma spongiae]|uniref:hypothetical protein n=1 Tax=Crateriforma spongiae TaxID=2724528 RepID=UPI0039B00611